MSKIEYDLDVPIKDLTTYKTQGNLPVVVSPKTIGQCKYLLEKFNKLNLSYFVIGKGSNLLISPQTAKICINLSKMHKKIKINGDFLTVSSNTPLSQLYISCKEAGLIGIEKACTIPASVGGFIKNNASFMGQDAFSHLEKITMLHEDKIITLKKSQCVYSYRHTQLPSGIIISATFRLKQQNSETVAKSYHEAILYRNEIQPKGFSCGCVFKNPEGYSAGNLIDQCGLKGKRKGGAIISQKHANFIINEANATFDDVKYLIDYCKEEVQSKFNVLLEEEVEIIH
ncbi:MAG: UDP-N-acetylmuramate dehydrogenase [Clostridia bacterium]|nr:UDP-N-acetylmuramate dehydrogenase [Clostridia bacterium]